MVKFTVSDLVELAKEVDSGYKIDWDALNIDKDAVYNTIASSVLERAARVLEQHGQEHTLVIMMASLTNVLVENFVLNVDKMKK